VLVAVIMRNKFRSIQILLSIPGENLERNHRTFNVQLTHAVMAPLATIRQQISSIKNWL